MAKRKVSDIVGGKTRVIDNGGDDRDVHYLKGHQKNESRIESDYYPACVKNYEGPGEWILVYTPDRGRIPGSTNKSW